MEVRSLLIRLPFLQPCCFNSLQTFIDTLVSITANQLRDDIQQQPKIHFKKKNQNMSANLECIKHRTSVILLVQGNWRLNSKVSKSEETPRETQSITECLRKGVCRPYSDRSNKGISNSEYRLWISFHNSFNPKSKFGSPNAAQALNLFSWMK